MRIVRPLLMLLVLHSALAPGAIAQDAKAEKELMAIHRTYVGAALKGDVATLRQFMSPDSLAIDIGGTRASAAEALKEIAAQVKDMQVKSWDITDVRIVWADPTTAIFTYTLSISGTYQGQTLPSRVGTTTVWSRRGGKWLALLHHESAQLPVGVPPTK